MASEFVPTREDVYAAREILKRKLPPELGLDVLYQAGYWPCMTSELCEQIQVSQGGRICVFEEIVGREEFDYEPACRIAEVQFEIEGHDQGWTSEDTEGDLLVLNSPKVSIVCGNPDVFHRHLFHLILVRSLYPAAEKAE